MARQDISIGTIANDGTGDDLRTAGEKINSNFGELYSTFGADSSSLGSGVSFDSDTVVFAGTSFDTRFSRTEPTSTNNILLPDADGTVVLKNNDIVDLYDSPNTGKIYYGNVFDSAGDLPDASKYHGMFVHVHDIERAYYGHDGSWTALLDSDTFSSITGLKLTNPKMDTVVYDNTGNFEVVQLENVSGSPANYLKLQNSLTTEPAVITAVGDDNNVGIKLQPKGNGHVQIDGSLAYTPSVLTAASDSALDSASNCYIINSASTRSYKLHDGSLSGETKRIINRRNIPITIQVNNNKLDHPNGPYDQMTLHNKTLVTCVWDGVGETWFVDKDSSLSVTFA